MIYPLKRKHWIQALIISSPFLILLVAVILDAVDIIVIPKWGDIVSEILFWGGIIVVTAYLWIVNGVSARKYFIKKNPDFNIEELLKKYGFVHDANGKEGWSWYKEKDKADIWAGRIAVQDLGDQVIIIASKPSALKKELKRLSWFSEINFP